MRAQGKIYSRKVISEVLGISEKWVRELTAKGVLAEFSRGHYQLVPAIHGFIKHLQSQISDGDTASDYNVEKAKLARAKREDAELELQVKRNELHRSAVVEFIMTNMIVAFKAKLEVLPHKALPSILGVPDGKEKPDRIGEILKTAVKEALSELAEYSPGQFNPDSYMAGLEEDGGL